MPTLSNELRQAILKLVIKNSSYMTGSDARDAETVENIMSLIATQNTALLKEVADKVIGADEFPADQDEWHGEEEAKIIGADELRAVQRSKLAAMGVDDAK